MLLVCSQDSVLRRALSGHDTAQFAEPESGLAQAALGRSSRDKSPWFYRLTEQERDY